MADSDPPISPTLVGNLVGESSGESLGERLGALLDAADVVAWQASDRDGLRLSTHQATQLRTLLRRVASAFERGTGWEQVDQAIALFEPVDDERVDGEQAATEPGGALAATAADDPAQDDAGEEAGAMSSTDIPPPDPLSATMPGDILEVLAAAEAKVAAQQREAGQREAGQREAGQREAGQRVLDTVGSNEEHTAVSARPRIANEETMISEVALPQLDPLVGEVTMLSAAVAQDGRTRHLNYRSDAHGFALTVEEYAAFCAERDADPARIKPLRARYDIPHDRGHGAIDRYFEQLFARDPSMRQLWQHHYQGYALLLRQRT